MPPHFRLVPHHFVCFGDGTARIYSCSAVKLYILLKSELFLQSRKFSNIFRTVTYSVYSLDNSGNEYAMTKDDSAIFRHMDMLF